MSLFKSLMFIEDVSTPALDFDNEAEPFGRPTATMSPASGSSAQSGTRLRNRRRRCRNLKNETVWTVGERRWLPVGDVRVTPDGHTSVHWQDASSPFQENTQHALRIGEEIATAMFRSPRATRARPS